MLAQDLLDFRTAMQRRGIIFAYSGYVTESVLGGVGDAVKQKLAIEDADTKTIRSVFSVFVEQMQNIIRYSAEKVPPVSASSRTKPGLELRYGVLTIGKEGDDYVVNAGNLIDRKDLERIRERLQRVVGMNRAELKNLYKEQLRAPADKNSKGAGLGFTEIARRSTKPIEFDFVEIGNDHNFFALKASV
jgi:hypothetical protein